MFWSKMEYKCGHSDRIQLYGKMEKKVESIKNKLCPECYKEEQKEKINKVMLATGIKVCELVTGSEKQINWADKIRKEQLIALSQIIDMLDDQKNKDNDIFLKKIISNKFYIDMYKKNNGEKILPELVDYVNNKIKEISKIDDAKTIIDNRNDNYNDELYDVFVGKLIELKPSLLVDILDMM